MTKKKYVTIFYAVVVALAVIKQPLLSRCDNQKDKVSADFSTTISVDTLTDSSASAKATASSENVVQARMIVEVGENPHKIGYVPSYKETFPDSQQVQLLAAERWGVSPVANRADAESRKKELVYVGSNPYYHVDRLRSSLPYLVPRAAVLLQDIGQAFYDSLYVKGIPLNQVIVTSVLRSEEDVTKLRQRNGNATERSCHLYGTTFDICYNRYHPVTRPVRNDTLKWVLTQVLRDIREQNRCYIKYEVKQGCFHMTVR